MLLLIATRSIFGAIGCALRDDELIDVNDGKRMPEPTIHEYLKHGVGISTGAR